jgi:hypothetical protein
MNIGTHLCKKYKNNINNRIGMKQKITFYANNEYINNKVYDCDSEIICETENFFVVKKNNLKLISPNKEEKGEEKDTKHIFVIITYRKNEKIDEFIRGYIYIENTEYSINSFTRYTSLQIGKYAYDNIGTCYLQNNIFG